jgi:hypothetical protein
MFVLAGIMIVFLFRSPLASWYLHKKIASFNEQHQAELKIGKVRILGLASIRITGISLKPANGDSLLTVDTAYVSIGILKLFAGRLSIHDVQMINTHLSVIESGSSSNWKFLFVSGKTASGEEGDTIPSGPESAIKDSVTGIDAAKPGQQGASAQPSFNYARMAEQMFDFTFDKIPLRLDLRNFTMLYVTNGHRVDWLIGRLDLRDHFFRTTIEITEDSTLTRWALAGLVDNHQRKTEFRIYPVAGGPIATADPGNTGTGAGTGSPGSVQSSSVPDSSGRFIPFLNYKWNAHAGFDTLAFGITANSMPDDRMELTGSASVKGLVIDHRKIATMPVHLDKMSVEYRLLVGDDHFELDSSTTFTINKVELHPYLLFRPGPPRQITLHIRKPWFQAQDLFSSFPPGLFTVLDGLSVKGKLAWHLDFIVDVENPDSLYFDTSLDRQQFSVVSYGNSNLTRLNESFAYTAYEKGEPVRTFIVGPDNPNFRTLAHISPFLQFAVMTSEDGGFYQHRGFLADAFRESIVTNIRERRFARGGSTISMQLVKNVFLSRNKTIARKLEEALIVWLIENQGLCTKERMFEVYLNIIEWGPLVYGANEASRFYFNKDAGKLTLAEAIFMASVIPRPKAFRWSFDDYGRLRDYNAEFYRLVSNKMLSKGWITPADAENLVPQVELKGPAKQLLKNADTTSIFVEPD